MLSSDMQKLLLNVYFNYATTGSKSIPYHQVKQIYKSKVSFKRAVNYLLKCSYLNKNRLDYFTVEYSLTLQGEMLARLLCSMPDIDEKFKQVKWRFVL